MREVYRGVSYRNQSIDLLLSNQAMKFGQLIEYIMRNWNWNWTLNWNWTYLWTSSLKFYIVCLYVQVEGYWNILKLNCRPLAFIYHMQSLFKRQKSLGLVPQPHFLHDFWKKLFSCYILLPDQILLSVAFNSWNVGEYVYFKCFLTRLWRHKFWN